MKNFFHMLWQRFRITNWWSIMSFALVVHMAVISIVPGQQFDIEGDLAQAAAAIVFAIFGASERQRPSTEVVQVNPPTSSRRQR